jgi:hypothetical protein
MRVLSRKRTLERDLTQTLAPTLKRSDSSHVNQVINSSKINQDEDEMYR